MNPLIQTARSSRVQKILTPVTYLATKHNDFRSRLHPRPQWAKIECERRRGLFFTSAISKRCKCLTKFTDSQKGNEISLPVPIGFPLHPYRACYGPLLGMRRPLMAFQVLYELYSGLCSPETPNLTELAESVDDTLFQRIMHNPHHVLYHLLPERRELVYRPRHHDRQLSIISGQLRKRNFIYRMLFKDSY